MKTRIRINKSEEKKHTHMLLVTDILKIKDKIPTKTGATPNTYTTTTPA